MSTTSTSWYNTLTHPDTMITLLANFLKDRQTQAIAVLQNSGVSIANSAPAKDVQIAWLKAIKDSQSFRSQAAATLTGYVTSLKSKLPGGQSNFVAAQPRFYNDVTDFGDGSTTHDSTDSTDSVAPLSSVGGIGGGMPSIGDISAPPSIAPASISPTASDITASAPSSGGFFSSLGSLFSPSTLQSGVTTGLQALSTNMTASANSTSEANALKLAQAKLAAAQLAAQPAGLSAGWMIVIGVGILAIVITAVMVMKKK